MASFYYGSQHHQSHTGIASQHHHSGRSRRATRASAAHHHNQHKQQIKAMRLQQKEAEESAMERAWNFRKEFEAARSFDLEDDELFCPFNLLTDDDLQSMHSGSDRSSLSSGSPDHSPLQTQVHPSTSFLGFPSLYSAQPTPVQQPKLHQPLAQRVGKAIPIVDPSTRNVASPPPSVSPARQLVAAQQFVPGVGRRPW